VRRLGTHFVPAIRDEFGSRRLASLVILGDVNLAPETPVGGSKTYKTLKPEPHGAWDPLANLGFKPRNFATTNLDLLVSEQTGSKVYDNFVVQDAMAGRMVGGSPRVIGGSPRVICTDEEEFARWLSSREAPPSPPAPSPEHAMADVGGRWIAALPSTKRVALESALQSAESAAETPAEKWDRVVASARADRAKARSAIRLAVLDADAALRIHLLDVAGADDVLDVRRSARIRDAAAAAAAAALHAADLEDFKSDFLRANYNAIRMTKTPSDKNEPSKWFSYGLGYSDHRCLVIELDVSAMPAPPLSSSTSAAHNESQSFIHGDGEDTVYTDESAPLFDEAFIAELEEEAHEEEEKRYPARCLAETQSGTQCKNPAKPFSRLCGVQAHAKLAKPADGGGSGGEFPDAVWKFE
jgi:hypothetical protein